MRPPVSARSYLYVPGDRPDRIDGAAQRGSDAVILDLEDGVSPAAKADAMRNVGNHLRSLDPSSQATVEWWVRLDPTGFDEQLGQVVSPALRGVFIPKAEPELLAELDQALAKAEEDHELGSRSIAVIPLIETPQGIIRAAETATSPRIQRLGMGEADLRAELGIDPSDDEREMLLVRSTVVLASAAAGIAAPVASTSTDFRDLDRLRRTTTALARLGFRARTSIHPAQVGIINEVFMPGADEIQKAQAIVDLYDQAIAEGRGSIAAPDGTLVDLAVVLSAREVLGRAGNQPGVHRG